MSNRFIKSLFIICLSLPLIQCSGSNAPSPTGTTPPPVITDDSDIPITVTETDTDGDGLTDNEEISLGTNIASIDSDEDGLTDFEETHTNTDPILPDTDGDGIPDGEDEITTFVNHEAGGVTVALTADRVQLGQLTIEAITEDNADAKGIDSRAMEQAQTIGAIGGVWKIHYTEEDTLTLHEDGSLGLKGFDTATLSFAYPESYENPEDLTLATWNGAVGIWQMVDAESVTLDRAKRTVTANVPHFSAWVMVSRSGWDNFAYRFIVEGKHSARVDEILSRHERWPHPTIPYHNEWLFNDLRDTNTLIEAIGFATVRIDLEDSEASRRKVSEISDSGHAIHQALAINTFKEKHRFALARENGHSFSGRLGTNESPLIPHYHYVSPGREWHYPAIDAVRLPLNAANKFKDFSYYANILHQYTAYYEFIGSDGTFSEALNVIAETNMLVIMMRETLEVIEEYTALGIKTPSCLAWKEELISSISVSSHNTLSYTPFANSGSIATAATWKDNKIISSRYFGTFLVFNSRNIVDSVADAGKNSELGKALGIWVYEKLIGTYDKANNILTTEETIELNELLNSPITKTEAEAVCRNPCDEFPDEKICKSHLNFRQISECIANGHAWEKHVISETKFDKYGFKNRSDFALFILEIMLDSTSEFKVLKNDRFAWWSENHQTVVIYDANKNDCGTAFIPDEGKEYFDEEVK